MDKRLQVLTGARNRVAAGWCAGALHKKGIGGPEKYCAVGAIMGEFCNFADDERLMGIVSRCTAAGRSEPYVVVLAEHLPPDFEYEAEYFYSHPPTKLWDMVVKYNNTEGRTKEEVLALFDRAIASLQPANAVIAKAQDTDLIMDEIQEEVTA